MVGCCTDPRTAVVISEERDRQFSADTVEPILGEAAAQVLLTSGMLLKVLDALECACKQAYVLEGPRGELIGRFILILTMYECLKAGGKCSCPVPLQEFLTKLCGKEVKCSKGLVFFNRCCVVSGDLTQSVLLRCYLGCFAVIPRRNQEGYDFVIPVLYATDNGDFILEDKYMGAIPCQFRNRDSYVVHAAPLISWAKHFTFSGYARKWKRKRKEENFSHHDDDMDMWENNEEYTDFSKHICEYREALSERESWRCDDDADEELPEDCLVSDDSLMKFIQGEQERTLAARKRVGKETFQRRSEVTRKYEDEIENLQNASAATQKKKE